MDAFEKCRSYSLTRYAKQLGLYPFYLPFQEHDGPVSRLDGREIVMCGSNNYLGLTTDPRVLAASHAAIDRHGSSCTGSRLLNGNLALHEQLEAELAEFFGKPAALVFSTGFQANLGAISGLAGSSDVVLIDREAHASVVDGCKLSGATVKTFAHNNVLHLAQRLEKCPTDAAVLVVVDGVYSMAGDLAPLPAIVEVCKRFGARLIVDDAHGAGVIGRGRGTCAHFGVTDDVDLITLTFSKAFASLGGAVIGDAEVIEYLRHHARSEVFSAAMTPAATAAALTALGIIREEPWRTDAVMANARYVTSGLADLGYDLVPSESPILAVRTADAMATATTWRRLLDRGVYTNAVLPPAASARLRTSYLATHTTAHLDRVVDAFSVLLEEDACVAAAPAE